jgi:Immunity protein 9
MTYKYPKVRCQRSAQIVDLHNYIDFENIEPKFDAYIEKIMTKLNLSDLKDWRILINTVYTEAKSIGVGKRPIRYVSDTEVAVSILIPIPSIKKAKYGLPEASFSNPFDMLDNYWHFLDTDYTKFDNLTDYVFDAVIRCIDEAFKQGVTVNGKKIKYQN